MRKRKTNELNRPSIDRYKEMEKIPVVVVLDNVRSANNVGAVFRTSDALLMEAIYLCGITATPPNKEIRKTALDAEKSVDWKYFNDTVEAIAGLQLQGYKIVAVEQAAGSTMLPDFFPKKGEKFALVFGNEVKGVQQEVMEKCDFCLEIPQYGTKHSFNVSVCAGIILWDLFCKIR